MNLKLIQEKVNSQIMSYGGYWKPLSLLNRVIEEIGELARVINIKYGDKKAKDTDVNKELPKELSDVLYTFVAIANFHKIELNEEFNSNNIDDPLTIPFPIFDEANNIIKIMTSPDYIKDNNQCIKKIKISIMNVISIIISASSYFNIDLVREFSIKIDEDEKKLEKIFNPQRS